jgi:hypothetical protein
MESKVYPKEYIINDNLQINERTVIKENKPNTLQFLSVRYYHGNDLSKFKIYGNSSTSGRSIEATILEVDKNSIQFEVTVEEDSEFYFYVTYYHSELQKMFNTAPIYITGIKEVY